MWEERKLAYQIDGHRRGAYWLAFFRLTTDKHAELDLQFRLNNNIVRYLILRHDPRLEEPLVQHALHGPEKAETEAAEANVKAVDVYDEDEDDDEAEN